MVNKHVQAIQQLTVGCGIKIHTLLIKSSSCLYVNCGTLLEAVAAAAADELGALFTNFKLSIIMITELLFHAFKF